MQILQLFDWWLTIAPRHRDDRPTHTRVPESRCFGLDPLRHVRGDHVVAKHEQIGGGDARVRLQADAEAVQHVLETPHGLSAVK